MSKEEPDVTHWRKRWIASVLAETAGLTGDEIAALEFLKDYYWQHDNSLPDDTSRLIRIAKLAPDQQNTVHGLLDQFFPRAENGQRRHQKLDEEKVEALERKAMTVPRATNAANRRWEIERARKAAEEEARQNAMSNASSSSPRNA